MGATDMFAKKTVRDLMITLDRYAVVHPENTLREAVLLLRRSYCQLETGICAETGPRTALVVDNNGNLQGIIDFKSILRVLIPEVAGGLTEKLRSLEVSIVFAEKDASELDESRADFRQRVIKNSLVKVGDIMLKIRGKIQANVGLLEALKLIFRKQITKLPVYDGKKLVGVVRDTDLFLAVCDILTES
jgi:CBS domain-containing protein